MASRGARAKGTDGNDFSHRETVASHYQVSSTNKLRLKLTAFLHFLLFLFLAFKLSTDILQIFGMPLYNLHKFKFPKPVLWEWIWLSSFISVIPAYAGIRKNNVTAMKIYVFNVFVFGICPLLIAIIYYSGDMRLLLSDSVEINVEKFKGIPLVIIWSIFISIAFLVHTFSIMVAMNLITAWLPKKGKKRT